MQPVGEGEHGKQLIKVSEDKLWHKRKPVMLQQSTAINSMYAMPSLTDEMKFGGFRECVHWILRQNALDFATKRTGFCDETHWILR